MSRSGVEGHTGACNLSHGIIIVCSGLLVDRWTKTNSKCWYPTQPPDQPIGGDDMEAINIIFDGPPGPESGLFVEVETDDGKSINIGEWIERDDGLWALRIVKLPD